MKCTCVKHAKKQVYKLTIYGYRKNRGEVTFYYFCIIFLSTNKAHLRFHAHVDFTTTNANAVATSTIFSRRQWRNPVGKKFNVNTCKKKLIVIPVKTQVSRIFLFITKIHKTRQSKNSSGKCRNFSPVTTTTQNIMCNMCTMCTHFLYFFLKRFVMQRNGRIHKNTWQKSSTHRACSQRTLT